MSKRQPKPTKQPQNQAVVAVEHAPPLPEQPAPQPPETPMTGWHYLLVQALQKVSSDALEVHSFVKLGTLPLEADVILLHRRKDADLLEFGRYFGFLLPLLRSYLLIEYKGPTDCLTVEDFDTVLGYARLCKRKYKFWQDQELAVAMLYSATESEFFDRCAHNGFRFVPTQPGMQSFCEHAIHYHAVDLAILGERQPEHPLNLLSKRRRSYGTGGTSLDLGPFAVLYEEVFLKEIKHMSQLQVPGSREVLSDAERLEELVLSRASVEKRLRGLSPEDLVRGLNAEERARLRRLLLKDEGR
jgi:hypothetical protein